LAYGGGQPNISQDLVRSLRLPCPPLDEQKAATIYLDKKTALIDSTIQQKERLIELLQEERTAIINRAVTRGLDPNAPQKNSGVEWLGQIPEHWKKTKLKTVLLKIGSGVTPKGGAEVYQTSGIPLLRSQNIHFDGLRLDDVAYVTEDTHRSMNSSRVVSGDVLLNITGASIGRCFHVEDWLGEANVNQHVCILRPDYTIITKYLYYFLASELSQLQIGLLQTGANREGLNFEQLGNFLIPLPNVSEQQEIVELLDQKVQSLKSLSSKVQTEISLLKEYRTALINEIVTGKRCVT
jgi:type I restriction enzyme S subunit